MLRAVRVGFRIRSVNLLAAALLVSQSPACLAQIGASRDAIPGLRDAKRVYPGPQGSYDDALQTVSDAAPKITMTYLLSGGRIAAMRVAWGERYPRQGEWGGAMPATEAQDWATKAAGFKPPKGPKRKRPVDWIIDSAQMAAAPPLGAWEMRAARQPVVQAPVGVRYEWEDYYTKWGEFLGRSEIRTQPIVATYSNYLGQFKFSATKVLVPEIRHDGTAYMTRQLSASDATDGFVTREVLIAEAEPYWRARFAEFRQLAKLFDGQATGNLLTLKDLRPYALGLQSDYEEIIRGYVPRESFATILTTWKAYGFAAAVDNPEVSWPLIEELRKDCDAKDARAALVDNLNNTAPDARMRRARALHAIGSLDWVPHLAHLLKKKELQTKVLGTMKSLAADSASSPEEIEALGTDVDRWKAWHRNKVQNKTK